MKIHFLTIALDAMPWITFHYPEFLKLSKHIDWEWSIVEGVAGAVKDTAWCAGIPSRFSCDGTHQYLASIAFDQRIHLYQRPYWFGKVEMVNEPLKSMRGDFLLWQIDSDEIWTSGQILRVQQMFLKHQEKNCAYFWCEYFVGPDLRIKTRNTYGNHSTYEWLRVWKTCEGARFLTHEPPKLCGFVERQFTHVDTEKECLVFKHMAYATEKQVAFKEAYYSGHSNPMGHLYRGAVSNWRRLQAHRAFPAKLDDFLPWVGEGAVVERIS